MPKRAQGNVTLVVGTFLGDEGKGKIIDYLAQKSDIVARATGGNNAGHKVCFDGKTYPLHLLPSGSFNPNAHVIIGNGVYVNPVVLADEISLLEKDGFNFKGRLHISEKAHVIMPYHILMDGIEEQYRINKIGTTGRGIGPTAEDKFSRDGIRFIDFYNACYSNCDFEKMFEKLCLSYLLKYRLEDEDSIIKQCLEQTAKYEKALKILLRYVDDTVSFIHTNLELGKNLLIEGAQATLLDIDFGNYPFVTSSNPIAAGMCAGVGIGPTYVTDVVGVLKAYCSRVGEGPFVTEETGPIGDKIRELGHEYGTTTGRPRRCGWLDLVALKYACRINGLTALAINHLDTIGKFETIKLCVGYKSPKTYKPTKNFTSEANKLKEMQPEYIELPGDFGDISKIRNASKLPQNAIDYLDFIESFVNVPIKYIGVGPDREDLIEC